MKDKQVSNPNQSSAVAPRVKSSLSGIPGRWLTLLTTFAFMLGASVVQALVLNDGGTHTIKDATYQNERIIVTGGTTLIIESGAVLGGAGDFSGAVSVQDTSTVIINGGTFGGTGDFAGQVSGWDTATVTVNGGTFGGAGTFAGEVVGFYSATLIINGGTFNGGGFVAGSVSLFDNTTATISGGTFEGTGEVFVFNNAKVTFRAQAFDTTSFAPASGGTLGVTFCSQSEEQVPVLVFNPASLVLESIFCETAAGLIERLITEVQGLPGLNDGIETALVAKLNAALAAWSIDDTATTCARIQDFINLGLAQAGKQLTADTAASLIEEAKAIRGFIGCQ